MKDYAEFYKQVGQRIRSKRGSTLSQEALATAVGLTRTSISNIESGRQKMLLHTLVDIADALRIDAAQLLPTRPEAVVGAVQGTEQLAAMPENERAFIESAIGIKTLQGKGTNGTTKKKDTGAGSVSVNGNGNNRRAGSRVGNRSRKRSPHRS